jgi:hypothetical protein
MESSLRLYQNLHKIETDTPGGQVYAVSGPQHHL